MTARRWFRDAILMVTALSIWSTWLPMVRTLSGQQSYAWANDFFGVWYRGNGWSGDYLFLVHMALLGVTLLWLGFRHPRGPFKPLLLYWHLLPFANSLYVPLIEGRRNVFFGDTGGVRWDLTYVEPIGHGAVLLAVVCWLIYESGKPAMPVPKWSARNTLWLALTVLVLLAAVVLEWTGVAHGATDMIAVPLNIITPVLIGLSVYPWPERGAR